MAPLTSAPAALDVLLTLTTAIGRAATIERIYPAALDAIQHGLGVAQASILLFDADGVMRFKAWRGLSEEYRRAVEGHTPWTPGTQDAVPIAIGDVDTDPGLAPYLATIHAEGIRAMAFVPLVTDGGVTGKFTLYWDQPRVVPATELRLASVIAAQVAFAVQRVRAEQTGHARELQLRLVTDAAPVAIAQCDRDGRYKFVNRAYAVRFGLRPQDVVGRTMTDVLGKRAATSLHAYFEAAVRGQAVEAEIEIPYDALGPRMIHLRYEPEFDADGGVCGVVAAVLDVTEQYRTAVLKRYADQYLRALIDTTPECVKVVAADGTLVEMNAAGLQMVEASSAEAVAGRCVYDLIAPEHRDAFRAFNERICSGERGSLEFDIIGLGGTRRTMETTAVPLTARDGSIHQLAITREITQRRQAEAALVQSEAMFRQLAETMPQIIWTTGADRQPAYFNPRWYEFTGLPPGSFEQDAWRQCMHPEDQQPALDAWARSFATGEAYQCELRLRDSRTGAYRWHLARSVPVRDDAGKIVRWIGSSTDIDAQKRAERTSRFIAAASRTLATLVDYQTALQRVAELAVPDFADWCAVDMAEDGGLRRLALCHADPAKVELAFELERRYPPRHESERGALRVLKTGQPEMMTEIPDSLIEQAAYDAGHLALIRTLGLRSYISVPLIGAGRMIGVITFIATDDSGRRYDEHDLSVAQELAYRAGIAIENARLYSDLQRAARQKDEFLAVLAHELRNPLAPIRTALQLVEVAGDDASRRSRACMVMDRQLRNLVRLVDDLLDVSRITRGRIELQKQPSELAAILQNAIETSRPLVEANGHELTVRFPRDPIVVNADPTRIAQVFSNLLNNAAKYTPRGGHITLAAESDGPAATIRVRDSGIGIPREMLGRVFDMFVQVDRSFERSSGGLGIGLTLVKRLVEMHGGTVEARCEGPGTGTEFVVRLPTLAVEARPAAEDRVQAGLPVPAASRRVLVADDNEDAAECLADALRLMGHDVRTARDGMTAVELLDAHRPELVFLDLGMPRMDGYEAARRVRATLGSDVVIVAVTGWGQAEDQRRSQEAGFDRHLIKPIDISDLATLIEGLPTIR